jgi:hypothetical protein
MPGLVIIVTTSISCNQIRGPELVAITDQAS